MWSGCELTDGNNKGNVKIRKPFNAEMMALSHQRETLLLVLRLMATAIALGEAVIQFAISSGATEAIMIAAAFGSVCGGLWVVLQALSRYTCNIFLYVNKNGENLFGVLPSDDGKDELKGSSMGVNKAETASPCPKPDEVVKVMSNGRVVIPKNIRRFLEIRDGDYLAVYLEEKPRALRIIPAIVIPKIENNQR